MSTRRRLTPREKAEIQERQGGLCPLCLAPLDADPNDPTEYDHYRPLALMGEDRADQMQAVHRSCHGEKTKSDVKRIAKAKRRQRVMTEGRGRKRKGRPLQGRGFDTRFRRKMDGSVVPR